MKISIIGYKGHAGGKHVKFIKEYCLKKNIPLILNLFDLKDSSKYSNISYLNNEVLKTNPDIVIIATPPVLHFEISKFFLENKIDVLCEKPLTLNKLMDEYLYKLSIDNDCRLLVNYQYIYSKKSSIIKDIIKNNNIECINIYMEITRPKSYYLNSDWRYKEHNGGDILFNQFSHILSIISPDNKILDISNGSTKFDYNIKDLKLFSKFTYKNIINDCVYNFTVEYNETETYGTNTSIEILNNILDYRFEDNNYYDDNSKDSYFLLYDDLILYKISNIILFKNITNFLFDIKKPLISFCGISFYQKNELLKCIDTIQKSNIPVMDYEIIITEDSGDLSNIVENPIVEHLNIGFNSRNQSLCYNNSIKQANGLFILTFDGDDYYDSEGLNTVYNTINNNQDFDIFFPKVKHLHNKKHECHYTLTEPNDFETFNREIDHGGFSILFKKSLLNNNLLYDERKYNWDMEDLFFNMKLLDITNNYFYFDNNCKEYYIHTYNRNGNTKDQYKNNNFLIYLSEMIKDLSNILTNNKLKNYLKAYYISKTKSFIKTITNVNRRKK